MATLQCADRRGGSQSNPVYALVFNPRQRDFVATGNGAGVVHVWRLSWRLSNLQAGEQNDLEALMKNTDEVDDE